MTFRAPFSPPARPPGGTASQSGSRAEPGLAAAPAEEAPGLRVPPPGTGGGERHPDGPRGSGAAGGRQTDGRAAAGHFTPSSLPLRAERGRGRENSPRGTKSGSPAAPSSPAPPDWRGARGAPPTLANTLALCWIRSRKGWKYGESWNLPGYFGRTFAGSRSADVHR